MEPTPATMETKEELVESIKEWIKIDGDILKLQHEVKERRNKKKLLTESLVQVMKKNEIDCFDINGGSLVYKKNKVKKPINSKTLVTSLKAYFAQNPAQAEEVTKFVMDNREEQIKETIKRKIDK
jgi:hypothetical protein